MNLSSLKHISSYKKLLKPHIQFIKKIPLLIGKDAFLFMLIFILIDILFGEFLFYKYVFLAESKKAEAVSNPITFQESAYKSVLDQWEKRQESFSSSIKEYYQEYYQDPFQKK